jgi:alanine dehydrogenase
MKIGVPREIKNHEYRVGMVPAGVHVFVSHGHDVVVEEGAGLGSGVPDSAYTAAGATLATSAAEVYASADMIV